MLKELSPKQKRFCQEYLIDLNATKAAVRSGYSKKTAKEQGSRLLTNVAVSEFIKSNQDNTAKRLEITAQMVSDELYKVGFANIQDYIKKGFTIEDIQKLKKEHAAAIESISIEETKFGTKVKFKLHDKISALEKLGKHIGYFKEDNIQQGTTIKIVRE